VTTHPTPCTHVPNGDVPVASERNKDKKHEGNNRYKDNINNVKNSMGDVKKYNEETQQGGVHPKA
jgi:hypothetical protein